MRARKSLPCRKLISWPSASRIRVIASSGLRWPVAGIEAIRLFMILVLYLPTRRASLGLPTDATPSGAISGQPRSRPNVQHGERARLPENFRDWTLRYVCNAAADGKTPRNLSL